MARRISVGNGENCGFLNAAAPLGTPFVKPIVGEPEMQWYVSQKGKTTGPIDEERLAMLVRWGRITRDAFICDKQFSAWITIRCSAFAQLLPRESVAGASLGTASEPGPAPDVTYPTELETKQALGLVALSVILAGILMAAL
jgi:hypothetical protein